MKKLASTTAALVLAAAAGTAFAGGNKHDNNYGGHHGGGYGECKETPSNPTGQCPKPEKPHKPETPKPQPQPVSYNQNQTQQQQQHQQQQANAKASAAANVNTDVKVNAAGGNANATGGTGIGYGGQGGQGGSAISNATGGQGGSGYGGQGGQGGNSVLTDNSHTTQSVTDASQNNSHSSGNAVTFTDNSRSEYRAAANRAAPDAAPIIGDGSCKTALSVSLGVGTLGHNVGASIGGNMGWSEECAAHELKILEKQADSAREASLRASEDPVNQALAHEQAKQSSGAYAGATKQLETRIEQMSMNGQPVEVKNWHALGGLNVVVKKPVVTTVTPPSDTCQSVVNVYLQAAAQAARSTGKPAAVKAPKTGNVTCDAEVAKALKDAGAAAPKP